MYSFYVHLKFQIHILNNSINEKEKGMIYESLFIRIKILIPKVARF